MKPDFDRKRIAIVNHGTETIQSLRTELENEGISVDLLSFERSSVDRILNETYHGVIVESIKTYDTFSFCDGFRSVVPAMNMIFLTDIAPISLISRVLSIDYPNHLIHSKMAQSSKWILATLKKFLAMDPSGIQFYSNSEKQPFSFIVNDSKLKDKYIREIIDNSYLSNVREKIIQIVEEILDEMITNVLYNAPTDVDGKFLYQHFDRKEAIVLSGAQSAVISCIADNDKIYISAKDPFGSLTKKKYLTYLSKCYTNDQISFENKKGGAGIGLHKIFRLSHNVVLNISPGKFTEMIVTISRESVILKRETASLSIFVKE